MMQSSSTDTAAVQPTETTHIRPTRGWAALSISSIWRYRDLLLFLAWRDISVRYKQTVLGAAWAIIQPLFSMVIFTLFFGELAKIPSDGIPYPLFSYAALLPWTYFANAITASSNSLVGSQHLITRVYFPRLVVPLSAILPPLVDFAIAFLVLIGLMAYFAVAPTLRLLWLPFFMLHALATALGVGLWLASLNVRYRDVRYTTGFLIQFWMFASPVVYPASMVPDAWRALYAVNPMVGVIEGFRWALTGAGVGLGPMSAMSIAVSLVLLVSGAYYFRRVERDFADIV